VSLHLVMLASTGMLILSTAVNWSDAKRRVLKSYREWIRAVCCSSSQDSPIMHGDLREHVMLDKVYEEL
jgi:hypothetical protein